MNCKILCVLYLLLALLSCSNEPYSLTFNSIDSYNMRNARSKGWFMELVTEDALNLKCDSYLSKLLSFSKYEYLNQQNMDSLIVDFGYLPIPKSKFVDLQKNNLEDKPKWFLDDNKFDSIDVFYTLRDEFIAIDKGNKIMYCISLRWKDWEAYKRVQGL